MPVSDYDDFFAQERQMAVGQSALDIDSDPATAARAIDLAAATGVPAPVIHDDLENFETQHKAMLSSQIVRENAYLQDYINSHPLASKVSANDWANLDEASDSLAKLHKALTLSDIALPGDPFARFKNDRPIGDLGFSQADLQNHPLRSALLSAVATPPDIAMRVLTGIFETGADIAANIGTAMGGPRLGRELGAVAETEAMGLSGRHPVHLPEEVAQRPHQLDEGAAVSPKIDPKQADAIKRIMVYADNQRPPPPALLPEYDKFIADQNAQSLDLLDEAFKAGQSSETKELSPETYANFVASHLGNREIGISADAIDALYGDKAPAPDDNLLGWLPDIQDKLDLARATGSDVKIPVSDWLAKADPEVAKALHDDIRMQPNWITANEAKAGSAIELPEPSGPIPEPLPMVRAGAALDPMLSIGDRNLKLERLAGAEGSKFGPAQGFHDFSLNDEQGNPVGTVNLSEQEGGKKLYVEMINGINGLGPRDFGPALMKSILRQLKTEFPNAKTLGGFRVSGMREKFDTMKEVEIKLDRAEDHLDDFRRILEGGQWEQFSPSIQGYVKPDALQSARDRQIVQAVNDELDRIVPKKTAVQVVDTIKADTRTLAGQNAGEDIRVGGAYLRFKDAYPIILAALDSGDVLGTARHEAIHHLRQYGFFNHEEWSTLEAQALAGGWLRKYKIDERYPTAGVSLKLEEAVAEAFTDWMKGQDALKERAAQIEQVPSPLDAIFQKLKDFFDRIKARIGELIGKDPTWEDIFKKVDTGEVGNREGTTSIDPKAFDEKLSASNKFPPGYYDKVPQERRLSRTGISHPGYRWEVYDKRTGKVVREDLNTSIGASRSVDRLDNTYGGYRYEKRPVRAKDLTEEETKFLRANNIDLDAKAESSSLEPKLSVEPPEGGSRVFERGSALGMNKDDFARYDKLMQEKFTKDLAFATKRAMEEKAREQTKQWKADRKALRQDVAADIRQRPDVAADLFFGSGELYGKKVPLGSVKLAADALTNEQKAGLPRNYYGEHGMHPDDVASLFGYASGDAMVERLIGYNAAKLAAGGMSAKDFVNRVTDIETDRQMQQKYGVLEDNILDAAKEHAVGEVQQNILHEETVALGMKIGKVPLSKELITQGLREALGKMPLNSVSSDAYMRAAGKAGRQIESGLLHNDPEGAYRAKQQQAYATIMAHEMVKLEKDLARFNKLAKRYARPFDIKSHTVDAKYSLFNRNILSMVERPYGMSVQGLAEGIARSGYSDLRDFATKQNALYGIAGVELPVADFLQDPGFHKPFDELTVDEARQVMDAVKALDTFGRNVEKVNVAGAKEDRRELINKMAAQLQDKFAPLSHGASEQPSILRHYIAASTKPETFFARFDNRDPYGIFTKTFALPAAKASNYEAKLAREFSKAYGDAGKIANPTKKIEAPFFELNAQGKRTNTRIANFTRENLHAVIANMGNEYNWRVLAKGWDLDPQALWKWVEANTTAEDIDRAQAIGNVFKRAKVLDDNVHDAIYGVAPESISVRPFTMHGKQYEGWYHPIIYDPIRSKLSKLQGIDPTEGNKYRDFWPSVASGHTIRRTGNIDVISLSNDMVPIKLNQVLHSIAYREFVHDTAKITRDNAFRHAITERYGPEYVEQIDHWINSIAGAASYNSQALAAATNLSNRVRQNVISTYIAFSPITVEKHGLTAAKFSMQEVGHRKFSRVFAEVAADKFMHAVRDLFGRSPGLGETLWDFAVRNSEELQRRDRNYLETFTGQQDQITGKSSLRNWIIEKGSKAVAFSDMLSAVPTWLARYREALEETGGDVGAATEQGDRAVRRAHGSTAISNRSMIESGKGPLAPWMTSIYGFFGTDLQRQMEIAHDVNDAWKLGKEGELGKAFGMIPNISSNVFTYVIWTGIVEEAVASQFTDDHRSLLSKALSTTLGPLANTWVGLRDLIYSVEHNTDPTPGLMSSPLHDVAQLIRDAKKPRPVSAQNAGKLVQDAITVFGDTTGKGPRHIGTAARYGIDVWTGKQKPKTAGDIYRGVVTGQQAPRKER